ncbi:lasso peptide biosynthesis B2 protein [Pseudomonas sp. ISL-84]|nr:lasso peptide biosynthesis B2 protein [Pseudomonas sp. ISL-84]
MKTLLKLKEFIFINTKTKFLFIEAFLFLGWARFLKVIPFSKVASTLGDQMNETSHEDIVSDNLKVREISHAIHIMSRFTLWESECLVKAIAGMKMLERRNIESTLYLGTARDDTGKMIAHAWLRSGPIYICGSEEMDKFTIVGMFAKKISSNLSEGKSYEQ